MVNNEKFVSLRNPLVYEKNIHLLSQATYKLNKLPFLRGKEYIRVIYEVESLLKDIPADFIPLETLIQYNGVLVDLSNNSELTFNENDNLKYAKKAFETTKIIIAPEFSHETEDSIDKLVYTLKMMSEIFIYKANHFLSIDVDKEKRVKLDKICESFFEFSREMDLDLISYDIESKPQIYHRMADSTISIASIKYMNDEDFDENLKNSLIGYKNGLQELIKENIPDSLYDKMRITYAIIDGWVNTFSDEVIDDDLIKTSQEFKNLQQINPKVNVVQYFDIILKMCYQTNDKKTHQILINDATQLLINYHKNTNAYIKDDLNHLNSVKKDLKL